MKEKENYRENLLLSKLCDLCLQKNETTVMAYKKMRQQSCMSQQRKPCDTFMEEESKKSKEREREYAVH